LQAPTTKSKDALNEDQSASADGLFSELPRGKLANVVTCLEMREKPDVSVPAPGALFRALASTFARRLSPAVSRSRRELALAVAADHQ